MLISGKKIALRATKKNNILTPVLSGKKILNETKNHYPHPLCKLNGRSLTIEPFGPIFNDAHFLTVILLNYLFSNYIIHRI